MYLTKVEDERHNDIGPMMGNQPTRSEVRLDEQSIKPKINNADESRLQKQISRIKSKSTKGEDTEFRKESKQPLKSALRKRSSLANSIDHEKDNSQPEKTSRDNRAKERGIAVDSSTSNYKKQDPENPDSLNSFGRKHKLEDANSGDEALKSLQKDLKESVVPVSKRAVKRRKRKQHTSRYEEREVNLNKARKRKDRNARKVQKEVSDRLSLDKYRANQDGHDNESVSEESSDESDSSYNSISSGERDELLRKYFRKILCPILKEEREQTKKETMGILEDKGLFELAEKCDLINYDSLRRDDSRKDPFLEDEGFAPSDVSGATTPRKTPSSVVSNKSIERKDSFKLARTSQSQERKALGTPKRRGSIVELKKQVIMPNESVEEIQLMPIQREKSSIPKLSNKTASGEKHQNKSSPIKDRIESAKKNLFADIPKASTMAFASIQKKTELSPTKPIESVNVAATSKELDKKETEVEKPKLKSIFGPSKDTVEELRKGRSSNTSSPSFGESRNNATNDSVSASGEEVKKPSLFNPKSTPIVEKPNEEDSVTQETPAKSSLLFSSASTVTKPGDSTVKPSTNSGSASAGNSNPFLNGPLGGGKPKSLFGATPANTSDQKAQEKPKTSLFGNSTSSGPIFGRPLGSGTSNSPDTPQFSLGFQKGPSAQFNIGSNSNYIAYSGQPANPAQAAQPSQSSSLFGKPLTSAPTTTGTPLQATNLNCLGNTQGSLFGKPNGSSTTNSTSTLFAQTSQRDLPNPGLMDSDDVGMGGVTPPNRSPVQPRIDSKLGYNQSAAPTNPIFGNQGSGGSVTQSQSSSLFGNAPSMGNTASSFSLGTNKPNNGSLFPTTPTPFASAPSQGQPEPTTRAAWTSNPFGDSSNKRMKKKNESEDDGLFSDSRK